MIIKNKVIIQKPCEWNILDEPKTKSFRPDKIHYLDIALDIAPDIADEEKDREQEERLLLKK